MDNPVIERLKALLQEKREKNPRFGLRALARQLDIPAPTLSRVLTGKRGLTLAMARKIVRGITDNLAEQRRLLRAYAIEPKASATRPTKYRYLSLSELERLSHWGHSAVLETLQGHDGIRSLGVIAQATGLTEREAEQCLRDLAALKLVSRNVKRGWHTQGHDLSSIRWEGTPPWKNIHRGYAERGMRYIESYDRARAVVQGITFLVPPEKIEQARERIREFAEELSDELAHEGGPELYRLNVQLFPLGKGK
jgi:uncharacterized protein (TIGR02147 family)